MLEWVPVVGLGVAALVWGGLLLSSGWWRNERHVLEGGGGVDGEEPLVVIVCPGRDEGAHLRETLGALCRQDYGHYRVVFVDDQSTDETGEVLRELEGRYPGLIAVRNESNPPAGWVGKCWAVHLGVERYRALEAGSEGVERAAYFCFTDADIHWGPGCLRANVAHALEHGAGLVALFPRLEFGSVLERLAESTMVLALWLLYPFERSMRADHPGTLSGGAFMLIGRDFYDAADGHRGVRGEVVEDLALGRAVKAAGARVRINVTRTLMWCRMYEGAGDLWEGLTKNAYAGLGHRWWLGVGVVLWTLLGNVLLPAYVLGAVYWYWCGGGLGAVGAGVMSCVVLLMQAWPMGRVRRLLGLRGWYTWAVPLGSGIYMVFMVVSMYRHYRGGNLWKGRRYDHRHGAGGV